MLIRLLLQEFIGFGLNIMLDATFYVCAALIYPTDINFDPKRRQLKGANWPFYFVPHWIYDSASTGRHHKASPRIPSRTTVDKTAMSGWRTGAGSSVVHIGLVQNGQCVDRNGNGVIDTSQGLGDIKPWPNDGGADTNGGVTTAADECLIQYVRVRSTGTRHVSVDANNDVWVSGTGSREFDLVDGKHRHYQTPRTVGGLRRLRWAH